MLKSSMSINTSSIFVSLLDHGHLRLKDSL